MLELATEVSPIGDETINFTGLCSISAVDWLRHGYAGVDLGCWDHAFVTTTRGRAPHY